jgi:hypothetical protein
MLPRLIKDVVEIGFSRLAGESAGGQTLQSG